MLRVLPEKVSRRPHERLGVVFVDTLRQQSAAVGEIYLDTIGVVAGVELDISRKVATVYQLIVGCGGIVAVAHAVAVCDDALYLFVFKLYLGLYLSVSAVVEHAEKIYALGEASPRCRNEHQGRQRVPVYYIHFTMILTL